MQRRGGLCRVLAIDLSTPAAADAHVREEIYLNGFIQASFRMQRRWVCTCGSDNWQVNFHLVVEQFIKIPNPPTSERGRSGACSSPLKKMVNKLKLLIEPRPISGLWVVSVFYWHQVKGSIKSCVVCVNVLFTETETLCVTQRLAIRVSSWFRCLFNFFYLISTNHWYDLAKKAIIVQRMSAFRWVCYSISIWFCWERFLDGNLKPKRSERETALMMKNVKVSCKTKWMNQINHDGKCPWVSGRVFCCCVCVCLALNCTGSCSDCQRQSQTHKGVKRVFYAIIIGFTWTLIDRLNCVWSWESEIEGVYYNFICHFADWGTVFLQSPFSPGYIKLSLNRKHKISPLYFPRAHEHNLLSHRKEEGHHFVGREEKKE